MLLVVKSELSSIGDPNGHEPQMRFLNVLYWLKTKADLMCVRLIASLGISALQL